MVRGPLWAALAAALLAGCSGNASLTTGSLFGGDQKSAAAAAAAPAPPPNEPTTRAFQVGTVSARAVKCGFNFDPARLKANYLASEAKLGATPEDMAKIEKIYNVAYNGVAKAVAATSEYCTEAKTKVVKGDLTRHLAGDYTPSAQKPAQPEDDDGLFSFGNQNKGNEGFGNHPMDNSNI